MKQALAVLGIAAAVYPALAAPVSAQTRSAVAPYEAVTDRVAYPKPAVPALGPAGSALQDPVFKSTIFRVTDAATRPAYPNRSYRTPSSPHQNSWSVKSSYFYVMGSGGAGPIPYSFDPSTGTARRIQASGVGDGGMVLKFYIEPQFSYVDDSIIYGSSNGAGSTKRTIDQYDFNTGAYTRLMDLDTIVAGLSGTYIGSVASSGGPTERIMAFFGGTSQDRHRYVVVFDRANPQNRHLVDTIGSTVDGVPSPVRLDFSLHHVMIDRSGRYAMLYTTSADQAAPRSAAQEYLWDIATGGITELGAAALPYGHDAFGYGAYVNKDCCTTTTWDAGQWQFRNLSSPLATRDLIGTVLTPKAVYVSDHTTWNNARPDRLMPVISGLYRFGTTGSAWRAWDDEIVAIQTDAAGGNSTVWRFAHHRSNVDYDGDPSRTAFWYQPHPNVSQDGRWVLFTSNWEKTLGTDAAPEAGTAARQDVFLLQLKGAGPGTLAVSRPLMALGAPGADATVSQPFVVSGWAIDLGADADSGVDAVHVWAYPNPGSNAPPMFVGEANYGRVRGDLSAIFGSQFLAGGWDLTVNGMAPGTYLLAVFARSRITGTFNAVQTVRITIGASQPLMALDMPGTGSSVGRTFTVAGWAIDPATSTGSGVDAIHVWAYPNPGSGTAPRFVGVGTLGYARPDVAAIFGPSGAASGFALAGTLAPGVYDLVVFAHSSVTGTFNNALVVRVTID
jgi:hypothetical protein